MLKLTENTGIEIFRAQRSSEGFAHADLERVVEGIQGEDMVPVDVTGLLGSFASFGAFIKGHDGMKSMVGFARVVGIAPIKALETGPTHVAELGSVWVDDNHRGQGVGAALIHSATHSLVSAGKVPFGVCNENSRKRFETLGYEPVGQLPKAGEHDRIIELYEDGLYHATGQDWDQWLRTGVLDTMRDLPRFENARWDNRALQDATIAQ